MPHYNDKSEAKAGDVVVGKISYPPIAVIGTVVAVVPGTDTCNLTVQCCLGLVGGSSFPYANLSSGTAKDFNKVEPPKE